jgi:hypothetical protein
VVNRRILCFFVLVVIVDMAVWSLVTEDRAATAILCAMTAGYYYLRRAGFGG